MFDWLHKRLDLCVCSLELYCSTTQTCIPASGTVNELLQRTNSCSGTRTDSPEPPDSPPDPDIPPVTPQFPPPTPPNSPRELGFLANPRNPQIPYPYPPKTPPKTPLPGT